MRLLLVVNPAAGRRAPAVVEEAVRTSLAQRGIAATVDALVTRASDETTEKVTKARARYDIVAAVGGDGTVRDVATGLAGSTTPLAIIPNGTANVLAADLGIPLQPHAAASLLRLDAHTAPLDLGEVNGRPFVLNVGAGYAARIILDTRHHWKRRIGFLAYLPAAVRATFAHDRARTTIEIDGERHEGRVQMVFVANSGGIGGHAVQIADGVRYDDGLLTIAAFAPRSPLGTLVAFTQLAARRYARVSGARYWAGAEVRIDCDPPLPVQVDGDGMGTTPLMIRIRPAALRIIVPDAAP